MSPSPRAESKIPLWAMTILGMVNALGLPVLGWMFHEILDHDHRLTAMESNRFTAAQGAALDTRVSRNEDTLANGIPPQWFKDRVAAIEANGIDTAKRLTRIELLLEQQHPRVP